MPIFNFVSKRYPTLPGCYLMKDSNAQVIYVGKAKNLRRRLASYFQKKHRRRRTRSLVSEIRDIEIIIVHNETESLILENNLIKHYRPRYNRARKSKKSGMPYIVLTDEQFPRFARYTRHHLNYALEGIPEPDTLLRFGPFVSVQFRDTVLEFVRDHFQLRDCHPMPNRVCMLFHMHKCSGICEERVTPERYTTDVERAIQFLSLQHTHILHEVEAEMHACAERLEFERAQYIKEQVRVLRYALQNQVVERHINYDEDVIFCGETHGLIAEVRQGMVLNMRLYDLTDRSHLAFLRDHYASRYPDVIYLNRSSIIRSLMRSAPAGTQFLKPDSDHAKSLMKLCQINHAYRVSDNM